MTNLNEIESDQVRLQRLSPEQTVGLFERGTHPGSHSASRIYIIEVHRNGTSADYRRGMGPSVAAAATDMATSLV